MDGSRREFLAGCLGAAASALAGGTSQAASSSKSGAPVDRTTSVDAAAAFDGYGGIGDYAGDNGNTWQSIRSAHVLRDPASREPVLRTAADSGETYDLVIVGGGATGLAAAGEFVATAGPRGRCLLLENHATPGGAARRNEFLVDGVRLLAPQASNLVFLPQRPGDGLLHEDFEALGIPREFDYAELTGTTRSLEFDRSNYLYLWSADDSDSVGLYLDDPVFGRSRRWLRNPWRARLRGLGMPDPLRAELVRWRLGLRERRPHDDELDRWLDTMTYREYLVREHRLPAAVADWTEPFVASTVGLGASVVSAYAATRWLGLPGLGPPGAPVPDRALARFPAQYPHACFPGGNSALLRAFLKRALPDAIEGGATFAEVVTRPFRFDRFDVADTPLRIRLEATALDVRTTGVSPSGNARVRLTYAHRGRLHVAHARAVVMATGGWVNRRVVHDLPPAHRAAYERFRYSSFVVANVALRNWRFLERLGLTACLYTGGEFGYSCNLARPMHLGDHAPPLDPQRPAVLTFYAPVLADGDGAAAQGAAGRDWLLGASAAELQARVRAQMVRLFGDAGFDPARDIAAIALNRWGHAYVVPEPGFRFGRDGRPPDSDVVRENVGPIAFASAELRGLQSFRGAVGEARRAFAQVLPALG